MAGKDAAQPNKKPVGQSREGARPDLDFLLDQAPDGVNGPQTLPDAASDQERTLAQKRLEEVQRSLIQVAPLPPEPTATARFEPASLTAQARRQPRPRKVWRNQPIRNLIGYSLEIIVLLAALVVLGNWALQQAGISWNVLGAAPVADYAVSPSRAEGIFLKAQAAGAIPLSPTARPNPIPTFGPTVGQATAPVAPTPPPSPLVAVAPTPTPAIVPPILQSLAEGAAPPPPPVSPARRLLIPRLGLDTPVREVTVNLGNWQVADDAAGHHLGTAMPGQVGNMVLAGHRDIRGSIFLRLNELQKGDQFRVVTDTAIYRYVVTEVYEVAPSQVEVMAPTPDPTATLITCTPVGLATRRLIIKARLEK